jgi:hypothetical protein
MGEGEKVGGERGDDEEAGGKVEAERFVRLACPLVYSIHKAKIMRRRHLQKKSKTKRLF